MEFERLGFERYCAEIVTQTEMLVRDVAGADLAAPVPSCPGWTLGMLLRHIGGGHRWAEEIVRTRAKAALPDAGIRELDGDDSGPVPAGWLVEGARKLAGTLLEAGPDVRVWGYDLRSTAFWARRFTHETVVHRADAALAAGAEFRLGDDVAFDAVEEWVELDAMPQHFEYRPEKRELLGAGRSVALEAPGAAWFIDLSGDVIAWRRGRGAAAVTVRGSLTDLLLVVYQREDGPSADVAGDAELLALWRRHTVFG